MFARNFLVVPLFLLVILTVGIASASHDITDNSTLQDIQSIDAGEIIGEIESEEDLHDTGDVQVRMDTKIESKNVCKYYKEDLELISYLKDSHNRPISNKNLSIIIDNKVHHEISDNSGRIVLKLNLKPGTYSTAIKFDGDENFTASNANVLVNVKKPALKITAKNYKTYWHSDLFFKANVINKITKNPVKGVKVIFKVYNEHNKCKLYYSTTDSNGIAKLRKNFRTGSYRVVSYVNDNGIVSGKSEATLTVRPTAETGCTSLYVQVSNSEAVAGFRRDATNAKTIHIVKYKLNGKAAVKQYKTNSYFFHSLTTCDGWMAGTGGMDNPAINHAIERLAGIMIKSGKIKKSYLDQIQQYERILGLGHFSIKAPNGQYALVWASGIYQGKLKPGEYISVPNGKSCFRHGTWEKFSKNPAKAAIKIAATDSYGVNRRDATAFHWKATTSEGKTTSKLKVYGANDNGHLMGRSTGHLKDDIKFMGKFYSKNSLPKTPSSKLLGIHQFGNIDKLIKRQTIVKSSKLTKFVNESKTFDITVKDSKTKKPIKNLKIKLKVDSKLFKIKTNKKGIAKFNPKFLTAGSHEVVGYTDDIRYSVSFKGKIHIRE